MARYRYETLTTTYYYLKDRLKDISDSGGKIIMMQPLNDKEYRIVVEYTIANS